MTEPTLFLKPDRERSVLRRHPWIFSGAVARMDGDVTGGDTVVVRTSSGEFLARAAYNPKSQIVARIWSWDETERIDGEFFHRRITKSVAARESLAETTNALRWVNAESDGVPGLIADRYAGFVVCQFLTAGVERWKPEIVSVLAGQPDILGVYERSDVDVRAKEGLRSQEGVLHGKHPPELIEVWENAPAVATQSQERWRFAVDVLRGHKTGFYLDQKESRRWMLTNPAVQGADVLNAFSYTGGFGVCAAINGAASITNIDGSEPALDAARQAMALNGLKTKSEYVNADVFQQLRA
ncbi:MAG: class I SAM-dependent rRNA methyltransferase, partial [Chloroflexota bacterium]